MLTYMVDLELILLSWLVQPLLRASASFFPNLISNNMKGEGGAWCTLVVLRYGLILAAVGHQ